MWDSSFYYVIGGALIGFASAPFIIFFALRLLARWLGRSKKDNQLPRPPLPNTEPPEADYTRVFRSLSDEAVALESCRGQVLVLNFWATWCPGCVLELKELARLGDQIESHGIRLMCVTDESADVVSEFLAKREDLKNLPVLLRSGDLPSVYTDLGIPFTCVVSPQGRVVFSHCGAADWAHPDVLNYLLGLKDPGAIDVRAQEI